MAQICYRLDGIPLALELAAARTKVLSVEQIADRLDDTFRLLSAGKRTAIPRHRTLHATMDWSHELLPEQERILVRRLSVFAGGFTLKAVESMCVGEDLQRDDVLDLLSHLVDKSLVLVAKQDGETRYRLLETVRQYGWEKLSESGEEGQLREQHARCYLALAEEAEPELKGDGQVAWLERLERGRQEARAARQMSRRKFDEGFDFEALRRAIEHCDPDAMLGFYAEEAQLSIVNADAPHVSPFELRGKAEITKHLRAVFGQEAFHRVERGVADENRVMFREACEYPDGGRVWVETTLEVHDGKISRQVDVVTSGTPADHLGEIGQRPPTRKNQGEAHPGVDARSPDSPLRSEQTT